MGQGLLGCLFFSLGLIPTAVHSASSLLKAVSILEMDRSASDSGEGESLPMNTARSGAAFTATPKTRLSTML